MAKYYGSNWGTIKNKVGNAVGAVWNGINVMRQWVPEIANPNTVKQQLTRTKFRTLGKLARTFRAALLQSFAHVNRMYHTTPYAMFVKANWDMVSVSSPDDVVVNYSRLKISEGGGQVPACGSIDNTGQHLSLSVPFEYDTHQVGSSSSDMIVGVFCNHELGQVLCRTAFAEDGDFAIECPASWNGMDVHVYAFSVGGGESNKNIISDSVYVGHAEVQ